MRLRRGDRHLAATALCCATSRPRSPRTRPSFPTSGNTAGGRTASTLQYCLDARDPDLPVARKIGARDRAGAAARGQAARDRPEHGRRGPRQSLPGVSRKLRRLSRLQADPGRLSAMARGDAALLPHLLRPGDGRTRNGIRSPTCRAVQAIGATIGTSADIRLIQYLQALPGRAAAGAAFRWGRTNSRCSALARDTVGVALVWGPSFWALRQSDPAFANLRIISRKAAAGLRGRCRGDAARQRDLPAQQCRPGDRLLDGRRHHPIHSGQREISGDAGRNDRAGRAIARTGRGGR